MTAPLFTQPPTFVDAASGTRAWVFPEAKTVVIQTTGDMTLAVAKFLSGPLELDTRRRWPHGTAKVRFVHDWRSVGSFDGAARDLIISWGRGWLGDTSKVIVSLSRKASPFIHIATQTGIGILRMARMPVELCSELEPVLLELQQATVA